MPEVSAGGAFETFWKASGPGALRRTVGRREAPAGPLPGWRLTRARRSEADWRCPQPVQGAHPDRANSGVQEDPRGGRPRFVGTGAQTEPAPQPFRSPPLPGGPYLGVGPLTAPCIRPPGMGARPQDSPTWQLWKWQPSGPCLCPGGLPHGAWRPRGAACSPPPRAPVPHPEPPCTLQGPTDQTFLLFFLQGRAGLPSCQRWPP